MLVKDLIKRLEKMNPEAQVRISDKDGEVLLFVMAQVGHDDVVWFESESDCDMENEIQTRFDDAIENGTDELDVYAEMLEDGIDVDMVRRYMGNQAADHMQEFCESHGLISNKKHISVQNQQIITEEKKLKRFEKLKSALFDWGSDYIEEFLGFEYDANWDKDTIDNAMDEVYQQMDDEDLEKFYEKFCIE